MLPVEAEAAVERLQDSQEIQPLTCILYRLFDMHQQLWRGRLLL